MSTSSRDCCARPSAVAMADPAAATPWRQLMEFGFGVLGLSSREFWALTPSEINAALEAHYGVRGEPPGRAQLDRLMARFP